MANPEQWVEFDEMVLPSGRRLYANDRIFGISDELSVSEGFDGSTSVILTSGQRISLWR